MERKRNNTNTVLIATLASVATFLIGVVLSTVVQDLLGQHLNSPEVAFGVICILMLILIGLSVNVSGRLTSLVRTPTTVEYFDVTQHGVSEATLYSRAKELVDRAKDHIYIATTQSNRTEWIAGDAAAPERAAYFKSLLDRAQEGKKYSRILQTRDYTQPITVGSSEYLKHLREMIAMRDASNAASNISLSRSILGEIGTFVLVDDNQLIWEIDRREPLGNESRFRGFFLVYDPTREIISTFEEIWRRMTFDMRQVTESDVLLPGATASDSSGDPNQPTR